jgi:hypothetical protein
MGLINSWTEPEGPFTPGQQFTQVWHIKNNGTCEWLYTFEFVFASGDKTGENTSQRFGSKAPAGEWRQIRVAMRAPKDSGTYKASWRMTDGAGTQFGAVLPVSIKVGGPTNTPKPPTAAPDLAGTANAANTALAAQQQTATAAANATATAAANATATANCLATQTAGGTCP